MGISKTDVFSEAQNQIAQLSKALGHPARIAIIEYLLKQKTCICKDIVDELPLSQPTISQHLKALKTAGLIQGTISGNTICYCLAEDRFEQLVQYYTRVLNHLKDSNSNCCEK
ncbi:ArsR/SmtB family transcription factor [Aureispira anguillae]|uniref:Metalloregulator ArsR/SmtB family transcription factor n=1 Tax=Aureispira anguillae TaxID=2864201 RepID=A0A915YGC6_9BACT|nr:metalloregulator ArsR/SmtB family transcription factor [Aureispira anguillae]BDS12525.1 metalloregulator ArsR/SmtB family transcription factor [Aureispira anguillae]